MVPVEEVARGVCVATGADPEGCSVGIIGGSSNSPVLISTDIDLPPSLIRGLG